MRILMVIGVSVAICIFSCSSQAKTCSDDSIDDVSSSGEILKMLSGHIYEVDSGDTVDTQLWMAMDDVLVCEEGPNFVEIINTDESGEKASAERLK